MFYLDRLILQGFRNYQRQELQFHPKLNIVYGINGQGKTNIIESILYLSLTRSFRTGRDQDMVKHGESLFHIKGCFHHDDLFHEVRVSYQCGKGVKLSVNNHDVKRYEHIQQFPAIIFSPDDLSLVKEGPAARRRFINLIASRLNRLYFNELKEYQRVLMQRNYLLKKYHGNRKMNDLLDPWDEALVRFGANIFMVRKELIRSIQDYANIFFRNMTSDDENLTLIYKCSPSHSAALTTVEDVANALGVALQKKREAELAKGSSLVGPHLDEIKIIINNNDARSFASQGQIRTAVLALKMAEAELFRERNSFFPIILLDDVFSEFDLDRKKQLMLFLKENRAQCFITTAVDIMDLVQGHHLEYKLLMVNRGKVVDA